MEALNHLVIISGPSRSGKTYLIDQISGGQKEALAKQLGVPNLSSFPSLSVLGIQRSKSTMPEDIILHCDLCFQYEQDQFKYIQKLVGSAKRPCLVTLYAPLSSLKHRNLVRLKNQVKSVVKTGFSKQSVKFLKYLWHLNRLYRSPSELAQLYDVWEQEVCSATNAVCWNLDVAKEELTKVTAMSRLVTEQDVM